MNGFKRIYILKSSNGNVKIGVSSDVERRKRYFTSGSGYEIIDYMFTRACSNAYYIESRVHKHFDSSRLKGEWFNCEFDEAVAYVDKVFSELAEFNQYEDHTLDNLAKLTGISQANGELEEDESEPEKDESVGEVSSLIKNVRIVMERQESHPRKIAKQTELLLVHFGIPVIDEFVEPTPWEQLKLE